MSTNIFRVCVQGLEKFSSELQVYKLLKKALGETGPEILTISKPKKKTFAFIGFNTESDATVFSNSLLSFCELNKKNKKLKVKAANEDSFTIKHEKKPKDLLEQAESKAFQIKSIGEENKKDFTNIKIQDRVCPLWKIPYDEQISQKAKDLRVILQKLNHDFKKKIHDGDIQPNFLEGKTFCEIEEFLPALKTESYRNKTEFSIGKNENGEPTVGFNKGKFEKGVVMVEEGDKCLIIPPQALLLARTLQNYIRQSPLTVFDRFENKGFWRNLIVRHSERTKEVLVSIYVNMEGTFVDSPEFFNSFKKEIVELIENSFQEPEMNSYRLQGLLLFNNTNKNDSNSFDCPFELLCGEPFYHEILLGKKFRVSHAAFLQVNTDQCELLYSKVKEVSGLSEAEDDIVLFDLCSGIGTIGLTIGEKALKVIGVEVIESACKDSEFNAQLNGVSNYKTICSKVEDSISDICKEFSGKAKIVGIVDPPRGGLHNDVLKALRTCKGLDDLIYVSCNPHTLAANLITLCLPENKKHKAPPFEPKRLIAVDMFPQTEHYETLVKLKRRGTN